MLWEPVSLSTGAIPIEEHQEGWHPEYLMYEKQLRELCLLSLEKRGLGGNLTATLSYLKGVLKDRGRLFSGVCSKKMRGNRYITVKEIPTGHRKENFHHEGSQTQKLTARGGGGRSLWTWILLLCSSFKNRLPYPIPRNVVYSLYSDKRS